MQTTNNGPTTTMTREELIEEHKKWEKWRKRKCCHEYQKPNYFIKKVTNKKNMNALMANMELKNNPNIKSLYHENRRKEKESDYTDLIGLAIGVLLIIIIAVLPALV